MQGTFADYVERMIFLLEYQEQVRVFCSRSASDIRLIFVNDITVQCSSIRFDLGAIHKVRAPIDGHFDTPLPPYTL